MRLAECDAEDLDAFPPIESLRRSPASAERRRRSSWPVGRELPRDSTKEEHQMSPFGRRRPLMRAVAVGGGAYVAGKHRARAQDEQAAAESEQVQSTSPPETEPPAAETAAAASAGGLSEDAITKLKQISDLHASGVLSDEEFAQQKERLLA